MAKKNQTPVLELIDKTALLGKIQNNVEEETPEFKFPVQLLLERDELVRLLNDKKYVDGLFTKMGNIDEPSEAASEIGRVKLSRSYDGATVIMTLVDGSDAEFEGCILDTFSFEPLSGGMVGLWFCLYLKPGISKLNLKLQEHQNHEVSLTITNATIALKARQKQQELQLGDPDSEYKGGQEEPPPRGERAKPEARKKRASKRAQSQVEGVH